MDSVFAPQYMSDLFSNNLDHVLTSGSTGECLEIFWKKSRNIKSLIPLWNKRKRYYSISPNDKRCYFFTTKIVNGKELEIEESEYGLGFSKMNLSETRVVDIYDKMLDFNPRWMIVQPSMFSLLMTMAKKKCLQPLPNLTYIELIGERITDGLRRAAKVFFHCEIASQYGCYEVNSIAYECPHGSLHVMSENVYVESVEDNICNTSLQNKVMPFIRYKIGDKGRIRTDYHCLRGNKEPVVELFKARENDWIYHADGTVSHSDLFCHIVEQIIVQYQIIQTDYSKFEVYLVVKNYEMDGITFFSTVEECDRKFGKPTKINKGERHYIYQDKYEIVLSFEDNCVESMGVFLHSKKQVLKEYDIGEYTLQGCRIVKYNGNYNGTWVVLPQSTKRIRTSAFEQSDGTARKVSLLMNDGIERIDNRALRRVDFNKLPKKLKMLGDDCIYMKNPKSRIMLPKTVKKIGWNVFTLGSDAKNVSEIEVDSDNPYFKNDVNGWLYSKDGSVLYFTFATKKSSISRKVKKIQCELML